MFGFRVSGGGLRFHSENVQYIRILFNQLTEVISTYKKPNLWEGGGNYFHLVGLSNTPRIWYANGFTWNINSLYEKTKIYAWLVGVELQRSRPSYGVQRVVHGQWLTCGTRRNGRFVFRGVNFFFFIYYSIQTRVTDSDTYIRESPRVVFTLYVLCVVGKYLLESLWERGLIFPTAVFPIQVGGFMFSFRSFRTRVVPLSCWRNTEHIDGGHVRETCKYNKHYYHGKQNAREPYAVPSYFRLGVFSLFFPFLF